MTFLLGLFGVDVFIQVTPFSKQYAGSQKSTHQARERSLGTLPEQFANTPFEVLGGLCP
jgi:hypothetical protein